MHAMKQHFVIKAVFALCHLFFAKLVFCQFNDSTHYFISYASTGTINKTEHSNSYLFANALKFSTRKKSISLNSANTWLYGWQGESLTNNDFSSVLDFNVYKAIPHFYYWGLANYDKSYSLKINNRLQTGVGVAYSFVDMETAFFNISDGILYEASDLKINDSVNNKYNTLRNSLRIRYRLSFNKILILDGTHFWQPSFYDGRDYILKTNISLSVKLRKWLNLTSAAVYNKVNRTQRENLLVTFGLVAEHYF